MIKKILTAAAAALTLGGAVAATATPAAAAGWHGGGFHGGYGGYRGGWHRGGWGPGAAIGAGILGLAVGAAIADQPHYAYGPGYYGYGYAPCGTHLRWDPYLGRYVPVSACY